MSSFENFVITKLNNMNLKILFHQLNERLEYKYITSKKKKCTGQNKLFIYEALFLTLVLDYIKSFKNYIILYIGSAPGTHIVDLVSLFKQYGNPEWHFYDDLPHDETLVNISIDSKKINIFNKYFGKDDYIKYTNKNIILISDIRTNVKGKEPTTANLINDYKIQNDVLVKLSPKFSSLKYRCPFPDDFNINSITKPNGVEILQTKTPEYSAELRIFTSSGNGFKDVFIQDALEYEEKMFYYNKVIRKSRGYEYNIIKRISNYVCNVLEDKQIKDKFFKS